MGLTLWVKSLAWNHGVHQTTKQVFAPVMSGS